MTPNISREEFDALDPVGRWRIYRLDPAAYFTLKGAYDEADRRRTDFTPAREKPPKDAALSRKPSKNRRATRKRCRPKKRKT